MKKIVSILLVAFLVVSMIGCKKNIPTDETTVDPTGAADSLNTNNDSTPTPVKLEPEEGAKLLFWTGDMEFGETVAKNFETKFGVPVKVEEVGQGALDKVKLNGETSADVFMCPNDDFQKGMTAGVFLQLDDSIANDLKQKISNVGIKTVTKDDKLYGVPLSLETSCLFYNKDIVGDQPATTFEEIMEKAKSFNDPDKNKFYFLIRVGDGYKIYPLLSACGFNIFGNDGTDDNNPGFDSDEFEKGLELIGNLKQSMPVSSTDANNVGLLRDLFVQGKVAYEITGPWDIKEFKKSGVNFGVTTLPTFQGRPMTPFAGVQIAHISAYTKYPNAAQLFVQYLISEEAAGIMYEKAAKITTLKDTNKIKGLKDDPMTQTFVKQFDNSFPMPSSTRTSYFWTISAQVCQAVFDQKLTAAKGRTKAVEDWETLLKTE